ncbi:MAG: permease-like cell division protein FtsX [Bacteroidaceae bacterium]|nr:permease-like cell division protein FtsX [Bacteroidaceae bacterium]
MKKKPLIDFQFISSSVSTTLVLLLLGLVVFLVLSADNLSVYVRENINLSVLLSDDMTPKKTTRFTQQLEKKPYIKSFAYISKEDALREETEALGTNPEDFIGHNPFTASVEIKLKAEYANSDSIARIEREIKGMGGVMEVAYPGDLIDAVNENVRKISLILFALATLLTVISFALINNTIRLTIYANRFLIHTMKLVGADWSFIRRPFLIRSLWIGLISGICAGGILTAAAYGLVNYEPELIHIVTPHTMLIVAHCVLLCGLFITLTCAYISCSRYLKMKAATLYYI